MFEYYVYMNQPEFLYKKREAFLLEQCVIMMSWDFFRNYMYENY